MVRARFLKESALLQETAVVTEADFPRWEQELVQYSKVPAADDPRLAATLDDEAAIAVRVDAGPRVREAGAAVSADMSFVTGIPAATIARLTPTEAGGQRGFSVHGPVWALRTRPRPFRGHSRRSTC